jgi:Kef-type K+ transport system membrane component KefB
VLGLFPRIRLPAIVLEIVLGIVIGPDVLGWVSIDTPIQVISLLGVAFLLFLAGLEVDYERFRGRLLRLTALGYAISFGLALLIGLGLHAGGLVKSPLLVGIVLSATSLGIVIPVLKDAGQVGTPFGQLVIAGASIAEIATIVGDSHPRVVPLADRLCGAGRAARPGGDPRRLPCRRHRQARRPRPGADAPAVPSEA